MRRAAPWVLLALALSVAGWGVAGCGGGSSSGAPAGAAKKLPVVSGSPRELRVQRADLALVAHGLLGAEPSIRREVVAARAAWPGIVNGLPAQVSPASRALMGRALVRTERIATPRFVSYAGELTGAAAAIAGLLLSFEQLSQRGWTMTLAAARHLSGSQSSLSVGRIGGRVGGSGGSGGGGSGGAGSGSDVELSPAALRFVRANASLYIGGVYDGHYNLSVIGERMREAFAQLGGAAAFGGALRPGLIGQLAGFYSPRVTRLAPKPPASAAGG
jgi:hypothetical protein